MSENQIAKLDNFTTIGEMKVFAEELISSGLIPFKKAEEAVTVALYGKDLGIGFSVAMNSIYNIQGKPALSVHLAAGLAKRAGVEWQIEKDAEDVVDENGKLINKVTQIRFFRYNKDMKRTIENVVTYTWKDATLAGYTTKDNWRTKPKNMLRSRCLMEGIRFVAPDVLMGIFYEASELLDSTKDVTYDIDDEGNVITITDKNGNKIK